MYDIAVTITVEGRFSIAANSLEEAKKQVPKSFNEIGENFTVEACDVIVDEDLTKEGNKRTQWKK